MLPLLIGGGIAAYLLTKKPVAQPTADTTAASPVKADANAVAPAGTASQRSAQPGIQGELQALLNKVTGRADNTNQPWYGGATSFLGKAVSYPTGGGTSTDNSTAANASAAASIASSTKSLWSSMSDMFSGDSSNDEVVQSPQGPDLVAASGDQQDYEPDSVWDDSVDQSGYDPGVDYSNTQDGQLASNDYSEYDYSSYDDSTASYGDDWA